MEFHNAIPVHKMSSILPRPASVSHVQCPPGYKLPPETWQHKKRVNKEFLLNTQAETEKHNQI